MQEDIMQLGVDTQNNLWRSVAKANFLKRYLDTAAHHNFGMNIIVCGFFAVGQFGVRKNDSSS